MLLNNQQTTEEIIKEIKICLEKMTVKTWQLKAFGIQQKQLRGKFIAIQAYLKKQEKIK